MNGCKINYIENTVTITAAFQKAMQDLNSAEAQFICQLLADFPKMTIKSKTHRTPTEYHNKNGEVTSRNQFKNVTYDNMERFMNALPNGEKYLAEYDFMRNAAAQLQINGYALIRKWFAAQFPMFRSNPLFYITNETKVISAPEFIRTHEAEETAA